MVVAVPGLTIGVVRSIDYVTIPSNTEDTTVGFGGCPAKDSKRSELIDTVFIGITEARLRSRRPDFGTWGQRMVMEISRRCSMGKTLIKRINFTFYSVETTSG
jgi:hypothetical protein